MPVDFDLADSGGYIRSFAALHDAIRARTAGSVVELRIALPGGSLGAFLELSTLYLVAVRGASGNVLVLDGGKEQNYLQWFAAGQFGPAVPSGIAARYSTHTWKLSFTRNDLAVAAGLPGFIAGRNIDAAKAAVDRLAFAVCEAARFIPIRCAVACELAEDQEFKEVLARLAEWSRGFTRPEEEMNITSDAVLDDRQLRRLQQAFPKQNIKVFTIKENAFVNLTGAAKWLAILGKPKSAWTEADRRRMQSLRAGEMRYYTLRLGDFQSLLTNWQKFSAIASYDPNFAGLVDAFHTRYAAGSTPAENVVAAMYK